jgi:hypothetical protein
MKYTLSVSYKLFFLLIFSFFSSSTFASMFPNVYQKSFSKVVLKTRKLNAYAMPLVDAAMALPLEEDACIQSSNSMVCYLVGLGSYSFPSSDFGDYFAIDKKSIMKIKGDNAPLVESRDIRAEFVGGSATTDLDASLQGTHNMTGIKMLFQVSLEKFFKNSFFHNWFFSIRSSFAHLEQRLKMNVSGPQAWDAGKIKTFFSAVTENTKITDNTYTATGLENITFTLDGIYTTPRNGLEIYYYTGFEIPTTLEYNPTHFLFYPILGNNGNLGLTAGANFHGYFYETPNSRLGCLVELENHFLVYKTTNRTFDLFTNIYVNGEDESENNNKPWSRYLPAYSFEYPTTKQRVSEVSNLPCRIHPCNNLDLSLGVIFNFLNNRNTNWYLAGGYNIWMSQPEYLELQDRVYPKEYKNFYRYGIAGSDPGTTSQATTIKNQAPNDDVNKNFNYLSLDYASVVSDGGYSNGLFFRVTALGGHGWSVLFGGSFEIGKSKTIPSKGTGWLGAGLEF